jgi:hypothetical protein
MERILPCAFATLTLVMPKFDKYKPTPKILKPDANTGHLDDDQAEKIVEDSREHGVTARGLHWYWGAYDIGKYGVTFLKASASGVASVARFITSYPRKKPPK